ncbi:MULTISPECIES: hypothetical protein [Methylobacterium]|uniref:Uncharacterized protein n=2 Tax=Methylobacterium TaxID=407 RepID=A0A0C6FJX5_9HYPH|nr:hypothetical protein [Methylobacterium aquaticum]BAQ47357.1 hypothetical protein Maq22A_c21725 [Methylobacterium aquaticum]
MVLDPRSGRVRSRRLPGFRVGAALAVFLTGLLAPPAAQAQTPTKSRKVDCYVEADGKVLADGLCEFVTDPVRYGVGGFRLGSPDVASARYGAVVTVSGPGGGMATWNQSPGGDPEDGPSEVVTSQGACWRGERIRACAWKIGEGRPGFAGPAAAQPAAPQPAGPQPARLRPADCYLEVEGKVRLDGFCMLVPEGGQGGFAVRARASGKPDILARLDRKGQEPGRAWVFWNEQYADMEPIFALGQATQNGPCWENAQTRFCVWQAGQSRGDWKRSAGGAAPPAPPTASPSPARDAAGAEAPAPGTVLTLTFRGRCEALVIDGEDMGAACAPTASNESTAGSAQAVFSFGTGDARTVMFLASAKGWVENGTLRQPIDQLRYEEAGRSHLVKAKGVCEMPNPMGGPVVITCTAQSANTPYSARFRTDGSRPVLTRSSPG